MSEDKELNERIRAALDQMDRDWDAARKIFIAATTVIVITYLGVTAWQVWKGGTPSERA